MDIKSKVENEAGKFVSLLEAGVGTGVSVELLLMIVVTTLTPDWMDPRLQVMSNDQQASE